MVKEVEVSNTTEILEDYLQAPIDTAPEDTVYATLSGNGINMTVVIKRELKEGYVRKVALYYMLPKFEQQMVAEYLLGFFGPSVIIGDEDNDIDDQTTYTFDLSPVLRTIVHTAPEQLADDTITVRLYTYEANIDTDYGTKTLHVPYTVSYPSNFIVPASTDGWYTLRTSDIQIYNNTTQYYANDIVWYTNGTDSAYYNCIADSLGNLPTNSTYWSAMTEEEERNLYEFGHDITPTIPTLLNTNLLITRYIKQKYIYELLVRSNYKRADNIPIVTMLEKLFAMREAAVVHMDQGNPIMARHMLDLITIENNSFTTNNNNKTVIEMVTNFTI